MMSASGLKFSIGCVRTLRTADNFFPGAQAVAAQVDGIFLYAILLVARMSALGG
jgi:hypothetical protein